MNKIPPNAELFTVEQFIQLVNQNLITDDDGVGYWSTEEEYSVIEQNVQPSIVTAIDRPSWATHVCFIRNLRYTQMMPSGIHVKTVESSGDIQSS